MINFQDDPLASLLACIFIFAIAISIYYYVTRWVFSINERIKNQERQIELLEKIAEKLGVTEEVEKGPE